jgi:molybdopterin-guanine dinucleotide biosynthesis protein A
MTPLSRDDITGLLLAGGLGRRMGGIDKGLALLDGRPLAAHVLARLAPQVGSVLINANRNGDAYARLGAAVIPDLQGDFAGPLAGLEAGLAACRTPYLACAPCDSPFLPADLVPRLANALAAGQASVAVARTGEQLHPVFALMRSDVQADLQAFLHAGGRRMESWLQRLRWVACSFDDEAEAFTNINTTDELRARHPGDIPL